MIEDVVRRVERERGWKPGSSWRRTTDGFRYLPWSGLWLHETGLLYKLNSAMASDGMQVTEITETVPGRSWNTSVGLCVEGNGIAPFPPDPWNDPDVLQGHWRYHELRQPAIPLDFDLGPKQFHE